MHSIDCLCYSDETIENTMLVYTVTQSSFKCFLPVCVNMVTIISEALCLVVMHSRLNGLNKSQGNARINIHTSDFGNPGAPN